MSCISPPAFFSAKSCRGIFIPRISPPPPPSFLHSQVQGIRGGMAAPERSQHPQNRSTRSQVYTTQLSTVKLSTTNADRLQHRWTRQLLRGSALLPRPSTLKLTSLLLASEASLTSRSTLGDASRFTLSPRSPPSLKLLHSQVSVVECSARAKSASTEPLDISRSRGGGGWGARNRERKCRIPRISPALRFVLRLQKGGGVFAGHYGIFFYFIFYKVAS